MAVRKGRADAAFFEFRRNVFDLPDRAAAEIHECFESKFFDFMDVQTVLKHNFPPLC